ncbi:MAG: STAS domain-containing protein [Acidimicrobiia bacterium]
MVEPPGSARDASVDPAELEFRCDVSFFAERAAVVVRGEMDPVTADVLFGEMLGALALPIQVMTVDLSRVTALDDSGVDALLTAHRTAQKLGIEFELISVPLPVREVLDGKRAPDRRP